MKAYWDPNIKVHFKSNNVTYWIFIIISFLLFLFCLLLPLQFDLHGVCDQGSEDGVGLGRLDEWMLTCRKTKNGQERFKSGCARIIIQAIIVASEAVFNALKYSKMQLRYCLSLWCSIFKVDLFSEFITKLAHKCCNYCQLRLRWRISHCVTCNSCVAVALFSGFFTKHWLTKSLKDSDHRSGFLNVGGGLVGIMKMAWKRKHYSVNPELRWASTEKHSM